VTEFLEHFAFERLGLWPLALGLAVAAVVSFYRDRASPMRARLARLAAWAVLCFVIPAPVWRRPPRAAESAEVVFLVDDSLSMSVADAQRTPAERLRLAEALGFWSDPGARSESAWSEALSQLESVAASVAKDRAELDVDELTRRDPREARRRYGEARAELFARRDRLVKGSALPAPATRPLGRISAGGDAGSSSWLGDLQRMVRETRSALDATREQRLSALARSDAAAADSAGRVAAMSRWEVATAAMERIRARLPSGTRTRVETFGERVGPFSPAGRPSELGTDLSAACAAVTLAAGRAEPRAIVMLTDGCPTVPLRAAPSDVPVFVSVVAPSDAPPVATIRSVEAPQRLTLGEKSSVRVRVAGGGDMRVSVRMSASGQTQVREVDLRAGREQSVDFDLIADRGGEMPIEVSVEPASLTMRVPVRRVVHVSSEVRRVLFVGRGASWDAQLLLDRLGRLPWVSVTRADPSGAGLAALVGRAQAVVVFGVEPEELGADGRAALLRWGGPLLLLPDPAFVPTAWAGDAELSALVPGKPLGWRVSPGAEGSYFATPTAAGQRDFGEGAGWLDRTALQRFCAVTSLPTGASTLLAERDGGMPLVISGPRSLMLTTDQTWRWNLDPSRPADAFWDAVIRRWVPPVPMVSSGGWGLDVAAEGGGATVTATGPMVADSGGATSAPKVILSREGRDFSAHVARVRAGGTFTAEFSGLAPGQYAAHLDRSDSPTLSFSVGDGGERELSDLVPDVRALAEWVAPRGAALPAADLVQLADRISALPSRPTVVTVRLWDSPWVLGAALSLLTAEWAIRRHAGVA
jgi:hypothetical protein